MTLTSVAIVLANVAISTTCPVTAFPYDDMGLLDGVWRVVQGQHPGVDFYNPIGFGLFYLAAAWWHLIGPHRAVLALTSGMFGVIIAACASFVCVWRLRLSRRYCLLICSIIAFECSSPSVYGWSFFTISMAGDYNRLTVASIAVLFMQWFGKFPIAKGRMELSDIFVSAILLDIMFLVKISALGIGLFIIVCSLFINYRSFRQPFAIFLCIAIFLSALVAVEFWVTGVTFSALMHDYHVAATVRLHLASWDGISRVLDSSGSVICALLFILYAKSPPAISPFASAVAIFVFAVAQIGLNISNTQPATIYLAPACAVVLLARRQHLMVSIDAPEQPIVASRNKSLMSAMPAIVCFTVLIPEVVAAVFGLLLAVGPDVGLYTPIVISSGRSDLISLPVLGGFGDGGRGSKFATSVNRGIEALRHLKITNETIATLDYANPFPVLLGTPSPKGVPVLWALGYMEGLGMLSYRQSLFGNACIVMLPLQPTQVVTKSAELLRSAAAPLLSRYFEMERQDQFWKIYRKKGGCA